MNWDRLEGNWKQITGKVRERWGKLKIGRASCRERVYVLV